MLHKMQPRISIRLGSSKKVRDSALLSAARIIAIYMAVSFLWIFLSDRFVNITITKKKSILLYSIIKGWVFIIATSALFFFLVYRKLRQVTLEKEKAEGLNTSLQKSNALFYAIFESSPEIIVFAVDAKYCYINFNERHKNTARQIWNASVNIGTNVLDVIADEEFRAEFKKHIDYVLTGQSLTRLEELRSSTCGSSYWQNFYSPIILKNGEIVGASCFAMDVTERKKAEEEKQYLGCHDKLTGIFNRSYYESALLEIDRQSNYPISVIIGDVNGLKLINDAFGRAAGDEMLKSAAKIISDLCRPCDILARWGGDEFIILLPNTDEEKAQCFISAARERISHIVLNSIQLDISFGQAKKASFTDPISNVIKLAEDSMFRQKCFESKSMRSQTIQTILRTLHEKNPREAAHSKRVGEISQKIGLAMGYPEEKAQTLYLSGYLHDIGKIAIEETVLNKPGRLTDEEYAIIKKHPEIGCRIIQSSYEYSELAEIILSHHERWDGTGYPNGLKGEQIPVYSRIIAVADTYDAMTGNRTYRKSFSPQQAADEISRCAGKQFDPDIAELFLKNVFSGIAIS